MPMPTKSSIRLCSILPPAANTLLENTESPHLIRLILPILHHIKHLRLYRVTLDQFDELWRTTTPENFAKLESVDFFVYNRVSAPITSYDGSWWANITPFRLARNLRSVIIGCEDLGSRQLALLLLSMDFPWSQISFLDISRIPRSSPTLVASCIKNCTALQKLAINQLKAESDSEAGFDFLSDALRRLRGLHSLTVEAVANLDEAQSFVLHDLNPPTSLPLRAMPSDVWARLSFLDLTDSDMEGSLLRRILKECRQLIKFASTVPCLSNKSSAYAVGRDISLPHLTAMYIRGIEDSWIFQSLLVPALDQLELIFETDFDFDASAVRQMIKSSGCSLLDFECSLISDLEPPCYLHGLHGILEAIPTARRVHMGDGILLDEDISSKVARGEMLPCVEEVAWESARPFLFLQMIEDRVEWELKTRGHVVLQRYSRTRGGQGGKVQDDCYHALEKKYGLYCPEWYIDEGYGHFINQLRRR
ncbi:hypothetical protein DXG03_003018 [Asterophora parasitica]|uniref:Uncharacterized protein n=1 Tax=Asterophora parasitica TaxID=117018 RepID=A0A9P7KBY4_9AGAR|nr:hypothetical protein DXG03_003018 [Asterophora parasitica]